MEQYIPKSALLAEIEKLVDKGKYHEEFDCAYRDGNNSALYALKEKIDTLEVKEVDEQKERMSECPYRQVGCTMYEGNILECKGACSWVVDYPKLKELKARKGE